MGDVIVARKWFVHNSRKHLQVIVSEMSVEVDGLCAMLHSENAWSMADIVMLTFLRVRRCWYGESEIDSATLSKSQHPIISLIIYIAMKSRLPSLH